MSALLKNGATIRSVIFDISRMSISSPQIQQNRGRNNLNRPKLRNPQWFQKKERAGYENYVSPENQSFVKQVLHEKYGSPAIIKGVQTFQSPTAGLIKSDQLETIPWDPKYRRTGVLGRKIGQYPMWLKDGTKIDTTLLQVMDNHVIKYIPPEEFKPQITPRIRKLNEYGCLLVGSESVDPRTLTKEYSGLFNESGVMPKKHLARFVIHPEAKLLPGTPLNVTHFNVGDFVDVRGCTTYRGFQGVVKRHGFKGMPASHGVTKTHRRAGNIGGGGEKGRVWPGTKMPGHMGNRWRVLKGLKVWRINTQYNVMWVSGTAIPGPTNGLVYIFDTILRLRRPFLKPPFPTSFDDELKTPLPVDIYDENIHRFDEPTIFYEPEKE